jgi:uncharacterized protein YndB with AHSA1/START domain
MVEIEVEAVIAASPAQVWAVFADHESYDKWAGVDKVIRRRPGTPDPNGVGAVRTLYSRGPVPPTIEERVTVFEPGKRMEYDVIRGAPGRNAHGVITLEDASTGHTLVRWKVTMTPIIPGTGFLIEDFLGSMIKKGLYNVKERLEPEAD